VQHKVRFALLCPQDDHGQTAGTGLERNRAASAKNAKTFIEFFDVHVQSPI